MASQVRGGDNRHTAFGSALRHWREQRNLSQRALAPKIGISNSQLSRIEAGNAAPSRSVVTLADRVLRAGGKLIEADQRGRGYSRPRQLPAAPGWLVGRDAQLAGLDEALAGRGSDAPLLILIDGPAGAGKTALALRWAHRNAAAFPDGQLHADLKGFAPEGQQPDLATVLYDFCRSLGVDPADIPTTLEARASLYRSLMAGTRRLVMLDNVATADQVRHLLPGTAECAVVVTSRRVLTALAVSHEAHRVSVGLLDAKDAVRLLAHFVGQRTADEPEAVAELALLCGYLPLALRVAADLAVVHSSRSLADLAEEIGADTGSERLDAFEIDTSTAPRHVFSWTYRDLPTEVARVFRLIGLAPARRISVPAIAALAGINLRQARAAVRHLRAVHMLDHPASVDATGGSDVVSMHDLLHAYAAELVDAIETPANRRAAIHRLVLWTLHTARAAGQAIAPESTTSLDLPDLPAGVEPLTFTSLASALAWCDRERDHLLAISQLAARHGPSGTAWRLAVALWDWLAIRRPWDLWRETHLLGIRAAVAEHDSRGEAWVTSHWAEALRRQGHLDAAREHSDRVLAIHRDTDGSHGHGWAVIGAAIVALDQGELDRAQHLIDQMGHLEHSKEEPRRDRGQRTDGGSSVQAVIDQDAHAAAQVIAARILSARGDHDAALNLLRHIDNVLPAGNSARRHHLLPALAAVHAAKGDDLAAVHALERAAEAHAAADDRYSEADARMRCGDARARLVHLHPSQNPVPDWTRARHLFAHLGERSSLTALDERIRQYQERRHNEVHAC